MKIESKIFNGKCYEIVNKIPKGFFVWNIGEINNHEEYVQLCEDLIPNDKECYNINPNTLKAIKLPLEEVRLLMYASNYGIYNLETANYNLNNNRFDTFSKMKKELAEKTINIFKRISE